MNEHEDPPKVDLRDYLEAKMRDMELRFAQRMTEKDLRDEQRYAAQKEAVATAMIAQSTAMQTALIAQQTAMQAAQAAAEKAVNKAEVAAEKRFDSTNEFREQLRDQAGTLMPRAESEARMAAIIEKVESQRIAQDVKTSEIARRLDLIQGQSGGRAQSWGILVGVVVVTGILVGIIARLL